MYHIFKEIQCSSTDLEFCVNSASVNVFLYNLTQRSTQACTYVHMTYEKKKELRLCLQTKDNR